MARRKDDNETRENIMVHFVVVILDVAVVVGHRA